MNKAILINNNSFITRILTQYPKVIFLCDSNTKHLCLPLFNLDESISVITIQEGEANKSPFSLNLIWNQLLLANADRNTLLVNLGGGVITDIGGLAATTYNRGIKFIHVPTTLMGMVDAANGGKTGINFNGLKNYIGTFSEAESIFIWPKFLETLPLEQIKSGFAEMLKHGLIAHKSYWDQLSALDFSSDINWLPLIETSVDIKHNFVTNDFKENGIRKQLNFGHTIGHALESYFKDQNLTHGQFVAAGMVCETFLSHTVGDLDLAESQHIIYTLDNFFPRINFSTADLDAIAELTLWDKKNRNQKINTVLANKIGEASHDKEITKGDVIEALNFYIS